MAGVLDDSSAALLGGANFAHVSTLMRDGSPHVVPLWVGLDGEQVLFYKEEGSVGLRNIRRDPRVALSVADAGNPYRHCTVRGTVVEERAGAPATALLQELALAYTGRPYPADQLGEGVALVLEPERVRFTDLTGFGPTTA